jgi:hypothetical protein
MEAWFMLAKKELQNAICQLKIYILQFAIAY